MIGTKAILEFTMVDADCGEVQVYWLHGVAYDTPLIETDASMSPIRGVGTRMKFVVRL